MKNQMKSGLWQLSKDKTISILKILLITIIVTITFSTIFWSVISVGESQSLDQLFQFRYALFGKEEISPYSRNCQRRR